MMISTYDFETFWSYNLHFFDHFETFWSLDPNETDKKTLSVFYVVYCI